jgi:hypothetical protein
MAQTEAAGVPFGKAGKTTIIRLKSGAFFIIGSFIKRGWKLY